MAPEGRTEVQCALVHANLRERERECNRTNQPQLEWLRGRKSGTVEHFSGSRSPSLPSLPPSLAKQVQFRFSSNGKIAVGGVRVQLDSHSILRQGAGRKQLKQHTTYCLLADMQTMVHFNLALWLVGDTMPEPAIEIISTIEFVQFMPRMIFSG